MSWVSDAFTESSQKAFMESPIKERMMPTGPCATYGSTDYSGLANKFDLTVNAIINVGSPLSTSFYTMTHSGDVGDFDITLNAFPSIALQPGYWRGSYEFNRSGEITPLDPTDPTANDYPTLSTKMMRVSSPSDYSWDGTVQTSWMTWQTEDEFTLSGFNGSTGRVYNNNGGSAGTGNSWPDSNSYPLTEPLFLSGTWFPNVTPTAPYEYDASVFDPVHPGAVRFACPFRIWVFLAGMQAYYPPFGGNPEQSGFDVYFHLKGQRIA